VDPALGIISGASDASMTGNFTGILELVPESEKTSGIIFNLLATRFSLLRSVMLRRRRQWGLCLPAAGFFLE
jgi:hypothetical protein